MKSILLACLLMGSVSFAKGGHENKGADAQAVNAACATDAATAGCADEKVGTGLLKCLHAYKKSHKADFKFSDSCKAAMKTMHADHKAAH